MISLNTNLADSLFKAINRAKDFYIKTINQNELGLSRG